MDNADQKRVLVLDDEIDVTEFRSFTSLSNLAMLPEQFMTPYYLPHKFGNL